jgi:hypothetical protein
LNMFEKEEKLIALTDADGIPSFVRAKNNHRIYFPNIINNQIELISYLTTNTSVFYDRWIGKFSYEEKTVANDFDTFSSTKFPLISLVFSAFYESSSSQRKMLIEISRFNLKSHY